MHPQPTPLETWAMEPTDRNPSVAELARAHGRRVYHAAYRVLGDTALAEDVQQNVFLGLLEKPRADIQSWPAYLAVAATRAAVDELRRRHRWSRLTPDWLQGLADPSDPPETRVLQEHRARALRRALTRIRPREATCFALRYFQGMELADIARTLGLTENHVSVTLHRAVKSLGAQLKDPQTNLEETES